MTRVHLVDGTYELFRAFYGNPRRRTPAGAEVGAVRGIVRSLLALLGEPGVTHVGVAFDHEIESFRNSLYPGYKTGDGIEPELLAQFRPAEAACHALGLVTWPMVEFEADDALATAAERFGNDARVSQVIICSPDKDLAQCVRDQRVVCLDRMRRRLLDAAGVEAKFGVAPESIADWLALVGDSADGFPGIPRWGAKSASRVLAVYRHIDRIPDDPEAWSVDVRGARALADNLRARRDEARLFRKLATLRTDVPLKESLEDLHWLGPRDEPLARLADALDDPEITARAAALANRA